MRRLASFALAALLLGCSGGDKKSKTPAQPTARVAPDDVWASMRTLEKVRKDVDRGLTDWNNLMISDAAIKVADEIKSFPKKYDSLPGEFLAYADVLRIKAEETSAAAVQGDFALARVAWGEALKACRQCHEVWKGPKIGYDLPPETPRPADAAPLAPKEPPPLPSDEKKPTNKKKPPK